MKTLNQCSKKIGEKLKLDASAYTGDAFHPDDTLMIKGFNIMHGEEIATTVTIDGVLFLQGEAIKTVVYIAENDAGKRCVLWPEETADGFIPAKHVEGILNKGRGPFKLIQGGKG